MEASEVILWQFCLNLAFHKGVQKTKLLIYLSSRIAMINFVNILTLEANFFASLSKF